MKIVLTCLLLLSLTTPAVAADCPDVAPAPGKRFVVAISDLHFGLGRIGQEWNSTDDFRWHDALSGFLDQVAKCGKNAVDLVIAGDALELWQPPKEVACAGQGADLGCTRKEFVALVNMVVAAHRDDLRLFGKFADTGSNRVYFVAGNHDAALLDDEAWKLVAGAAAARRGRLFRCDGHSAAPCTKNAGWLSQPDGHIFIEHGHQIGSDVNAFSAWPNIIRTMNGTEYVERSWGQRFVQSLFNEQETVYPIIDNLMPESAGARFRMADRGLWKSAADMARFVHFNLLETSTAQKLKSLGDPATLPAKWDLKRARKMGYTLYTQALPADDAFRKQVEAKDTIAIEVQHQLAIRLNQASDDEVQMLCDHMALQSKVTCDGGTLGFAAEKLFRPKHDLMASHLTKRLATDAPAMQVFVYAHTHELESGWSVTLPKNREVMVYNTGAFQRLISEASFVDLAKQRKMSNAEALSKLRNEDLKSCYSAVVAVSNGAKAKAVTVRWQMDEKSKGKFVAFDNIACADPPASH